MKALTLPSPAKLNLFLHITGQRADGYHNLQTAFQLLDYHDTLQIHTRQDGSIHLQDNTSLSPTDNLVYQAAIQLKTSTGCTQGADIALYKRIPSGAGLGGGSSNAATTLLALNHLWNTQLSHEQLASLGLALGADIPVFIHGHSAWAEGVGEVLQPLALPQHWFLVIKPTAHIATEKIFSHKQLTRDSAAITVATFLEQGGANDCEDVVCSLYPEVRLALNWLRSHAGYGQLTGTGACVFSRVETKSKAQALLEKVPSSWQAFISEGVNQSPTHRLIKQSSICIA